MGFAKLAFRWYLLINWKGRRSALRTALSQYLREMSSRSSLEDSSLGETWQFTRPASPSPHDVTRWAHRVDQSPSCGTPDLPEGGRGRFQSLWDESVLEDFWGSSIAGFWGFWNFVASFCTEFDTSLRANQRRSEGEEWKHHPFIYGRTKMSSTIRTMPYLEKSLGHCFHIRRPWTFEHKQVPVLTEVPIAHLRVKVGIQLRTRVVKRKKRLTVIALCFALPWLVGFRLFPLDWRDTRTLQHPSSKRVNSTTKKPIHEKVSTIVKEGPIAFQISTAQKKTEESTVFGFLRCIFWLFHSQSKYSQDNKRGHSSSCCYCAKAYTYNNPRKVFFEVNIGCLCIILSLSVDFIKVYYTNEWKKDLCFDIGTFLALSLSFYLENFAAYYTTLLYTNYFGGFVRL